MRTIPMPPDAIVKRRERRLAPLLPFGSYEWAGSGGCYYSLRLDFPDSPEAIFEALDCDAPLIPYVTNSGLRALWSVKDNAWADIDNAWADIDSEALRGLLNGDFTDNVFSPYQDVSELLAYLHSHSVTVYRGFFGGERARMLRGATMMRFIKCDFVGADLSTTKRWKFSDNKFTACDFAGAKIRNSTIHLRDFPLEGFEGVDFTGSTINFSGSYPNHMYKLRDCDLTGVCISWTRGVLTALDLEGSIIEGTAMPKNWGDIVIGSTYGEPAGKK